MTASVQVANNTGVAVVAGSYNIPPMQIVSGTDFDTLVWQRTLSSGSSNVAFTWQSTVSDLRPGEARAVTLGSTIDFVSQGTPGTLELPGTLVVSEHIISLAPATQTVRPAEAAAYVVTLRNPTDSQVTYALSLQGLPSNWVDLDASVTVGPQGNVDVPLKLTSDAFAALSEHGFTVVAAAVTGALDSVHATLTLAGEPVLSDPEARGVVASLTPNEATAGQGSAARYLVQVIEGGMTNDTYPLAYAVRVTNTGSVTDRSVRRVHTARGQRQR